jgi:carnitine O-palmitoyltransferase 1
MLSSPPPLRRQLERIKIESERLSPGHHESKIGALTAGNRTAWAKARQDFFSRGVNRQSMEACGWVVSRQTGSLISLTFCGGLSLD